MARNRLSIVATLLASIVVGSQAAASPPPAGPFLCISEWSTGIGFSKRSGSWETINIAPAKYILKRVTKENLAALHPALLPRDAIWAVWDFGNDMFPSAACNVEPNNIGLLFCTGVLSHVVINLKNRRFVRTDEGTFVLAGAPSPAGVESKKVVPYKDSDSGPSYLEMGSCSAL